MVTLLAWPWLDRLVTGDREVHNVLDRPRDAPGRWVVPAVVFADPSGGVHARDGAGASRRAAR